MKPRYMLWGKLLAGKLFNPHGLWGKLAAGRLCMPQVFPAVLVNAFVKGWLKGKAAKGLLAAVP